MFPAPLVFATRYNGIRLNVTSVQGLGKADRPPASKSSVLAAETQPHCSDLYVKTGVTRVYELDHGGRYIKTSLSLQRGQKPHYRLEEIKFLIITFLIFNRFIINNNNVIITNKHKFNNRSEINKM